MTLPLHHRIDGPARAPVLVLAHPLAEDLDFWTPQLAELTPHWRVLRFDARGHGRSPAVDASLDLRTLGEDVLALLDGLGIADAHFCGLSIGGMTGMWLAAHHPRRLKSLVLSNCLPHLGNRDMWQARAEAAAQQPLREIVAQSATRWLSAGFAPARPDDVARLIDAATQMSAQSYAAYCRLLGDADLRAELARIERPVLVIGGSLDVATPPEQCEAMARQIRGARFVRLDGGHFVNWESPRDYARELNQFLAEHPR